MDWEEAKGSSLLAAVLLARISCSFVKKVRKKKLASTRKSTGKSFGGGDLIKLSPNTNFDRAAPEELN